MKIEIKALEHKDFSKVIDFAIQGMHFEKYVDGKTALRIYGRYFMYLELECATQVLAAYMGDRLVGVLMANIKDKPKLYSSFWRKLYVKTVEAIMSVAVKGGPDTYDAANKAMYDVFTNRASPDGEICFLAADPSMQGKGIGSKLLDALGRQEKGKLIYLYTDDNCTYSFYERKGFARSAEKKIEMDIGGKTVPLTCLLYSKQF